jgi:5-histidylcysteine sulfoxide synthase/putative 4-mercaptohistidine N1-methyltranferase
MNVIKNQCTTPTLIGTSVIEKRAELKQYFHNTWQAYESLFSLINQDQAYYLRPDRLRHPLVFYFGHTATFYINKLLLGKFINQRINPLLEAICAVGVDEMSWDDLNSEHYDWPTVDEVREYRQQVFSVVEQLIETMDLALPITQDSLAWIILMGCEHERIHLETSSVLMRMLPIEFLSDKKVEWPACIHFGSSPENKLIVLDNQTLTLGKKPADQTFGWDNEYGKLDVAIDSFGASKYIVSNQEFLDFVNDGGYQQVNYWTEEGQQWLNFSQAKMPRFWCVKSGEYFQRNLLNEIPLPLNWPVEVNYLEAKAFCQWKSKQTGKYIALPTEAQWYRLNDHISGDNRGGDLKAANINLSHYASSCPVDMFNHNEFCDVSGNVWQWTESAIDGYEGFTVHPLYDDFSTPTFDGKHNLIKGGSWISTGNETLKSARYAFRRHFFQHAGFRYVENSNGIIPVTPSNMYETDVDVCQQLALHFGKSDLGHKPYSQQIIEPILSILKQLNRPVTKLLDLGCSVGSTAFALSPYFERVDALDFSARYIQHAVQLQQGEEVRFTTINEGEITIFNEVSLQKLGLPENANNINFSQGDSTNLKENFKGYDVIVIEHALEKSYHPKKLLNNAIQKLNAGGILVIVSDQTFDKNITNESKWLGGIKNNGENFTFFDGLSEILSNKFSLLKREKLQRMLRINQHNYSLSITELTLWQRQV